MTTIDERRFVPGALTPFRNRTGSLPDSSWAYSQRHEVAREIRIEFPLANGEVGSFPIWAKQLQIDINELLGLPERWDDRRARAITEAAATSMAALLGLVMDDYAIRPQLFPLPDGGLQAEPCRFTGFLPTVTRYATAAAKDV